MSLFFILFFVLLFLTAIYYAIFFGFLYYWHETKETYVVVPILFTFWFFAIGFLIISIISISVEYLPMFLKIIK